MGSCFQALTGRFLSVPSAKPKTLESHTVLRLQAQLVLIWDFWNARLSYEDSLQFSFIYIVTNHNRSLYLGKVKTLEYYRKPQKPQQSVAPLLTSILVTVGRENVLLTGGNCSKTWRGEGGRTKDMLWKRQK